HRSTVVGASIVIEPLANDDDGNAEELHIARLDTSSLEGRPVSVALSTADETVSFRADEEGTYVFTYDVTDGAATATGLIRVDVASADRNRPPTAGRDLIVLPVQANARRTIDLLANDLDPDGDVMV